MNILYLLICTDTLFIILCWYQEFLTSTWINKEIADVQSDLPHQLFQSDFSFDEVNSSHCYV